MAPKDQRSDLIETGFTVAICLSNRNYPFAGGPVALERIKKCIKGAQAVIRYNGYVEARYLWRLIWKAVAPS